MDAHSQVVETEFYLLMLRIFVVQCARRAQQREDNRRTGLQRVCTQLREPWHIFLDCLCTLCDAESGGTTVVAIGVEQTDTESIFWIATNDQQASEIVSTTTSVTSQDARDFVHSTLQALAGLLKNPTSASKIHSEIFLRSVEFCKKRIAHYRKFTLKLIRSVKNAASVSADCES